MERRTKCYTKNYAPLKPIQPKCYVEQHIKNPRPNKMNKNSQPMLKNAQKHKQKPEKKLHIQTRRGLSCDVALIKF